MKKVLFMVLAVIVALLMVSIPAVGCKTTTTAETTAAEATGEAGQRTLSLLAWEGYVEPEWTDTFEKENNCKVAAVYIGSDAEIFTKLKAGGGKVYDMVSTNKANLGPLLDGDIILPIDESKIPNYANMFSIFKGDTTKIGGILYSIPICWGTSPMEINLDVVKEPYDSWGVLWDEQYKGKILMPDDPSHSITVAAIYLGIKDVFNLTDEDFAKCKELLIKQKPLVRTYGLGFGEIADAFVAKEVVAAATGGEYLHKLLMEQNVNAKLVIPKEGGLVWLDTWALVKGTQNEDLAYKWMNMTISKETQKILMEKLNYGGVTKELPGIISDQLKEMFQMYDENSMSEYFTRLIWVANPESWEKRTNVWNEVKSGA